MEPVYFDPNSLGPNISNPPMMLSRQHRLMLDTVVAKLPGVNIVKTLGFVTYWHFLCDQHEIVVSNATPAETLYLGQQACESMSAPALAELTHLFPNLAVQKPPTKPARTILKGARQNLLSSRLGRNGKDAVTPA